MNNRFLIIGGDLRQLACAKKLQEKGFFVTVYGFFDVYLQGLTKAEDLTREVVSADYVLLPLPVSKDGETLHTPLWDGSISLSKLWKALRQETVVFGGMINDPLLLHRPHTHDYAKQEDFLIKNAQITAEGAFQIVFSETAFSVFGSRILITGYGRIGKILARMAKAMGADTYVAARNVRDLSWIELAGCHPVTYEAVEALLPRMQIILNTVPQVLFQKAWIEKISPESLFVDLASVPGGIDWEAAKDAGIKTIWALSLPGKTAPYSSGMIISDTVINLLNKE